MFSGKSRMSGRSPEPKLPDMSEIRMRCQECRTKWFFTELHRQQPDHDMTTCGGCGGRLVPLEDAESAPEPP